MLVCRYFTVDRLPMPKGVRFASMYILKRRKRIIGINNLSIYLYVQNLPGAWLGLLELHLSTLSF